MTTVKPESKLSKPEQRFLSRALTTIRQPQIHTMRSESVAAARLTGIMNDADLIKHFSPKILMLALRDVPERRAEVLSACTGLKKATGAKMDANAAGNALDLALATEDTSPTDICHAVPSDDFVQYLTATDIWEFLFQKSWVNEATREHKAFMQALLDDVLAENLLGPNTPFAIVTEIGVAAFMSDQVPHEDRVKILDFAVSIGEHQEPKPFTAKALLDILPPSQLVRYVPLPKLLAVLDAVAQKYGWMAAAETVAPESAATATEEPTDLPPIPTAGEEHVIEMEDEPEQPIIAPIVPSEIDPPSGNGSAHSTVGSPAVVEALEASGLGADGPSQAKEKPRRSGASPKK